MGKVVVICDIPIRELVSCFGDAVNVDRDSGRSVGGVVVVGISGFGAKASGVCGYRVVVVVEDMVVVVGVVLVVVSGALVVAVEVLGSIVVTVDNVAVVLGGGEVVVDIVVVVGGVAVVMGGVVIAGSVVLVVSGVVLLVVSVALVMGVVVLVVVDEEIVVVVIVVDVVGVRMITKKKKTHEAFTVIYFSLQTNHCQISRLDEIWRYEINCDSYMKLCRFYWFIGMMFCLAFLRN